MKYISTRNKNNIATASSAIVVGLASDGGLYVPDVFPQFALPQIAQLAEVDYYMRAAIILRAFCPEFSIDELSNVCKTAYDKFDEVAPLVKVDHNLYCLELWHSPTHAFKDMALTVLPHLLTLSKKELGQTNTTLVLVATSGDTGKAALEGFKDVDGTQILVFYPNQGVSQVQKLQMMTQGGQNVKVVAINGNFDDAQTAVKNIFTNAQIAKELEKNNVVLSSANSINLGRLIPQVAYYFSAYADLVSNGEISSGDKVNFCVPSGNFGNILAAYYAHKMGVPINKLIVASNSNNVLTNFFNTGEYNVNREFIKTTSPSMDILISSNLERLVFELLGRDDAKLSKLFIDLKEKKKYNISKEQLEKVKQLFYADYANESEVKLCINKFFDEFGYIADPHTAVALCVYAKYALKTKDNTKTVVVSTASPYKFCDDVLTALGAVPAKQPIQSFKKLLNLTALPIPQSLSEVTSLPILHTKVIEADKAKDELIF